MLPIFLSTPSARRATHHPRLRSGGQKISIHALREEGDQNSIALIESGKRFLSTPSARRATLTLYHADVLRLISIHALREEGDFLHFPHGMVHCDFYPRPPRGGRRLPARSRVSEIWHFYPRPPRGGRPAPPQTHHHSSDFYPRPPRGGRHSKCVECDLRVYFYPRPPRGGRRKHGNPLWPCHRISIHALREEGDPKGNGHGLLPKRFLSTPSARRATCCKCNVRTMGIISIHALREEGDSKNGEKHLRFCFIVKRSAQIWKSLSKNIRKKSRNLHRTA